MKHSIRTVVTTKCLPALTILGWCCWIAGSAAPAGAVRSRCGATIRVTDRAVLVSTTQTDATLKWGIATGAEPAVFANAGTCINTSTHRALNCMLGAPGTLAAITPPASCTIFLNDMTGECAALVKNCIPGVRLRDGSFASGDPRIEALAHPAGTSTLEFTGVNLQVDNGTGTTGTNAGCRSPGRPFACCTNLFTGTCSPPNGLGNLFMGYNENPYGAAQTGSHNLIVGMEQDYESYGGLVAGFRNTIMGRFASVSGGAGNIASGFAASVSGGEVNTASGEEATVSGGAYNTSSGLVTSVSGGKENTASSTITNGFYASVSGGFHNTASGKYASVSGGQYNTASDHYSSVSGGKDNATNASSSSVSGGYHNTASANYASVSGGKNNTASGNDASVSGGDNNTASGYAASVSGGGRNLANTDRASVSGGQYNTASADSASVSGGAHLTAGSASQWHAGQTGGFPAGGEY